MSIFLKIIPFFLFLKIEVGGRTQWLGYSCMCMCVHTCVQIDKTIGALSSFPSFRDSPNHFFLAYGSGSIFLCIQLIGWACAPNLANQIFLFLSQVIGQRICKCITLSQ